ncbi:hypothetical protein PC9H_008809 [Pleurotus ostreatus]|uniref:Uncharacterized protein n=2 Tax=Pleurotus TaxID=5320 RepID=A0A8H6ZPI0_PLEOS|nr:uncharacterized protein PC9H_008809 [Pleurotus ostreatus]KAF7426440.1 hypothetical protein PC9H_008809 [Pleurotus ostreatus]KAG9222011.1 hypothetical protein CCMSSC00406_0010376 [Pleurotus cornucopiae]KAJ8693982.1 hypothetical protein PTI98_008918 [Pleurotus ostreatus]
MSSSSSAVSNILRQIVSASSNSTSSVSSRKPGFAFRKANEEANRGLLATSTKKGGKRKRADDSDETPATHIGCIYINPHGTQKQDDDIVCKGNLKMADSAGLAEGESKDNE